MKKIGILVDTTCELDLKTQDNPNLKIIALQIIFNDGQTFRDKYDISYNEMINSLDRYETKTSLPVVQDAVDAFEYFTQNGYTHIITVMLAGELSGTHQMVKTVSDQYRDKLVIENIDTKTTTIGMGTVVMNALDMIEQGKEFDYIVDYINEKLSKRDVIFAVETLKYLIRGGRISKLSGTVGEALDIKPLVILNKDGKLVSKDKARGRKKSLAKIIDIVDELKGDREIEEIFVLHGDRIEEGNALAEKLKEKFDVKIGVYQLGTLVAVHVGPGLVGAYLQYK